MKPQLPRQFLPEKIRVSIGSAVALGLSQGKLDALPTTAYMMTYKRGKCRGNCGFCPQARNSKGRSDLLSRISWPIFETGHAVDSVKKAFQNGTIKRVCIQALNYPRVFDHLSAVTSTLSQNTRTPISVSCQPYNRQQIQQLADAGAERIAIPLDAATKGIFDAVKGKSATGPYRWERQFKRLKDALTIFGQNKVSTHLIVGLGETEEQLADIIQKCANMSILPALFAFTPIKGTAFGSKARPTVQVYRRVQLARHLILKKIARSENMTFDEHGVILDFGVENETLKRIIRTGEPFLTSGCPDCNRPYYNEKPSGPIYNYPRMLTSEEILELERQFCTR